MNAAELEQAAATVRASGHPAAEQIADLLQFTAQILQTREIIWTACEYSPTVQADLTRAHFGREIAIARALMGSPGLGAAIAGLSSDVPRRSPDTGHSSLTPPTGRSITCTRTHRREHT